MNPGLGEETGSTIRSFIDALKHQPATLALSIVIIALLVFMYFSLKASAEFRETLMHQVLKNSEAIHQNTVNLQNRAIACPDPAPK